MKWTYICIWHKTSIPSSSKAGRSYFWELDNKNWKEITLLLSLSFSIKLIPVVQSQLESSFQRKRGRERRKNQICLFFAFDIQVSSPCFVFLEDAAAQTSQNDDITPTKKAKPKQEGSSSPSNELTTPALLLAGTFWTTQNSVGLGVTKYSLQTLVKMGKGTVLLLSRPGKIKLKGV